MLNELRRYNSIGDVDGITYLLELLLKESKMQKVSAQKLCALRNNIRLNFDVAVSLFKYLGIIEENTGYLYPTELSKEVFLKDHFERALCTLCFRKTISDNLLDTTAIHYSMKDNEYIIERYGFSVSAALFRNILIQFRALKEQAGDLIISSEYEMIFIELQRKNKVGKSLEKLKKQLEAQEEQGAKAEEFVINYESRRLRNHLKVSTIKQISVIDVTAGFDILSFKNEQSQMYDLFIEVKSYVGNPHFYWSENEIETAKLYEDKYCIYLVDATKVDNSEYQPQIIKNPAKNVLNNQSWIMNPTSYMVMPIW